MAHLSLLPALTLATPPASAEVVNFDLVEMLQRVFDEPTRETERRLEASRRRREFRLIQGGKP